MTFYILRALDYSDEGALERRTKVREDHFNYLNPKVDAGLAICGGAVLDESGKMIGSTIVFNCSREELDKYLESEPYVTGKVWEKLEINEYKLGPAFAEKYFAELITN
jgi:uncharacterized protein YciI